MAIASWQESYDKPRQCIEKQRHYSVNKSPYSQGYGLSRGHTELWELNRKEGGAPKNWCLWTMVLEKTPESPLDSKEINSVNLKGNQPWMLVGRTDAEAEAAVFWSSDMSNWLIGKVPFAGKDWGPKEKRAVRGWDGWMVSSMQWIWMWANFGRWWGTGKPGMLQSMGSQRVQHDWATEHQQHTGRKKYMWIRGGSRKRLKYIFTLEAALQVSGERIDYLVNGAGKIDSLCREKWSWIGTY